MGVGKEHIFNLRRGDETLRAFIVIIPLDHAVIHQKITAFIPFQQGTASGDFVVCAEESKFRGRLLLRE